INETTSFGLVVLFPRANLFGGAPHGHAMKDDRETIVLRELGIPLVAISQGRTLINTAFRFTDMAS
ncbi:MAG: hypothetical protein ACRD3W_27725, partial [Terriglobales bacterium]